MKFGKKSLSIVNSIVNNVYFLYFVAFVSLIDILGYIMRKEYSAVLFFYLIGMLTFYYTKNMSVVLLSALLGTTLLHFINNLMGYKEGMKGGKKDSQVKDSNEDSQVEDYDEDSKSEEFEEDSHSQDEDSISTIAKKNSSKQTADSQQILKKMKNTNNEKFKNKQGYQNNMKMKPALYNLPNKDQVAKQLGKADKMEKAYDNLEKIVGEKGFKSMNESTKNLIKQQDQLLKGLKEITPSINNAMESIGKIDFSKLGGMFGDNE